MMFDQGQKTRQGSGPKVKAFVSSSFPNLKSAFENPKCHLITLSARTNTFGGIVKPICLAAFRLMMNSNFFGCSTGRSAGLCPSYFSDL